MLSSFRKSSGIRSRNGSIARESKTHCEICQSKFHLITHQQHQCKRCQRAVCDKCYISRIKVYQGDQSVPILKVCNVCKKQDDLLSDMIRDGNWHFQMSSNLGQQWLKKLNKEKMAFQEIINEYEEMKFSTNQNTIKFKSQSNNICDNLFRRYNYSLRQFIGRMIGDLNTAVINEAIINVNVALYAYLKDMPYTYELVYFVVFMLCFCSQSQCYFIISRFISKIYPQYIRLDNMNKDNLLRHELKTLLQMYRVIEKNPEKSQMNAITCYLQQKFKQFIKSFTLNVTNVIVSFYLIDQIITTNSYIYFYQGIVSIIYHARQIILTAIDLNMVQNHILSYVGLEKVKNTMILFEKSNIKFQMQHEFFDSVDHRKLNEKYRQLEALYQKSEQKYNKLDSNYQTLSKDYNRVSQTVKENAVTIMNLQQELINAAEKLVNIEQLQALRQQNQLLHQKIKVLQDQREKVQLQYEQLQKKYSMQEKTRNIYLKLQEDYQREIVDLKTKNEVYQIEKLANDISFKTSYIDDKFQQKNKIIFDLQKKNRQLQNELQFYRNSRGNQFMLSGNRSDKSTNQSLRVQGFFPNNLSFIAKTNQSKNNLTDLSFFASLQNNGEEKASLKKIMEANKQVIDKLKSDLQLSEERREFLQQQTQQLYKTVEEQKIKLQLIAQINDFISQIPEELNYSQHIKDLESIIQSQNNLHKKTQLEGILMSYQKCVYEVRFRTIDAKLKQNQIKEENYLSIHRFNSSTEKNDQDDRSQNGLSKSQAKRKDDISEQLSWFGNTADIEELNKKVIKKQECNVM